MPGYRAGSLQDERAEILRELTGQLEMGTADTVNSTATHDLRDDSAAEIVDAITTRCRREP